MAFALFVARKQVVRNRSFASHEKHEETRKKITVSCSSNGSIENVTFWWTSQKIRQQPVGPPTRLNIRVVWQDPIVPTYRRKDGYQSLTHKALQ